MSLGQKRARLMAVRDQIDAVWRLVECGCLIVSNLDETEKGALGELLLVVQDRLTIVGNSIEAEYPELEVA